MRKQLFASFALAVLLPLGAGAQEHRASVSPFLEPLVRQTTRDIPDLLRGPLGGRQGRERLAGREALSLHLRTTASREELERLGVHVRTLHNGRATVTVLPENLPALAAHPGVSSIALPRQLYPVLSQSVPDTGITQMRTVSNGTFTGATGAGVVVGVIDSGIDFDHPNFQNAQGKTRIAFLWDQTEPTAGYPGPSGFGYGTEWTADHIDDGACTEQDELDAFGHGTHTTGIAAGSGAAPDENGTSWKHVGVAPESTIVFVKSDLASDHVVDALNYIFDRADELGLPAVINMSFGTSIGAHDGTDPMEEEIDDLVTAKPGRAVVVGAGNSRDNQTHAEVRAQANVNVPGPQLFVPSNYEPQDDVENDFIMIAGYYNAPDEITVQVISPSGEAYVRSLAPSGSSPCAAPINGVDGTVQLCNTATSQFDQATTAREILIGIYDGVETTPPKGGFWRINVIGDSITGNGEVDFWMISNLEVPPDDPTTHFSTLVDPYETVMIPGTSKKAITVGAHITRTCWEDYTGTSHSLATDNTHGEIAHFSGFGPTRDNRQKPELTAPGRVVIAPLAAEVKDHFITEGYGGQVVNDHYVVLQGTSMAAPHVTGAVALLLQDNPAATNANLRSLLASSARDDAFTKAYDGFLVNYAFGAGKLDLGGAGISWVDPYETNELWTQAYSVLSGQTLLGYVERAADTDYFQLQGMQAGDTVNATLTSLPQDYALALQARLAQISACGPGGMSTKASSNQPGLTSESITYTAPTSIPGTQVGVASYLRVTSSAGAISSFDSYNLKAILTRPETTSAHNSTATAQTLPDFVEMKVAGAISVAGELDFYKLSVMPGKTITLSTSPAKTLKIFDANGNEVGGSTFSVPPGGLFPSPKTFFARVSSTTTGSYTLTLKIQ